jgi:osmoprotectant transport system permease protein
VTVQLEQRPLDEAATTILETGIRPERSFGWRDFLTPAVCLVLVLAEIWYISTRDLDSIEASQLEAAKLWDQTVQTIWMSAAIAGLVLGSAIPLGVLVTRRRTRWIAPVVLLVGNVGQAAPTVGLLAIVGGFWLGFWAVALILGAYAMLSVLRNTIVGLQQVDPGVLDAARGMGMSPTAILFRVEFPLAVPVIGAGARTALVLAVATVPLGQNLGAGGLGATLFAGIGQNRDVTIVAASLFIAVLAVLMDWAGGMVQRLLTPKGIRTA